MTVLINKKEALNHIKKLVSVLTFETDNHYLILFDTRESAWCS